MTAHTDEVGLSGVAGVLAPRRRDLSELAASGLLTSSPEALTAFGFERAHICDPDYLPEEMALDAARAALGDAGLQPHEVDVVVWASARPEGHVPDGLGLRRQRSDAELPLHLRMASGRAGSPQRRRDGSGAAGVFDDVRGAEGGPRAAPGRAGAAARSMCRSRCPAPGAPREILYNVISDAACAVVVSRGCLQEKWLGFTQISRGYYCDPAACGPEIVAAYFPTAKVVIDQLLREHGLAPGDIDVVVPTGVNRSSWDILLRLVGISVRPAPCRPAVVWTHHHR